MPLHWHWIKLNCRCQHRKVESNLIKTATATVTHSLSCHQTHYTVRAKVVAAQSYVHTLNRYKYGSNSNTAIVTTLRLTHPPGQILFAGHYNNIEDHTTTLLDPLTYTHITYSTLPWHSNPPTLSHSLTYTHITYTTHWHTLHDTVTHPPFHTHWL